MFRPATKQQSKLRMTLDGPAGSGKTYTSLRFAHALAAAYNGPIAYIDTEHGSASKYIGEAPDGVPWSFDVLNLDSFSPDRYTEAIADASRSGYAVLVIDSLSHAWEGAGGALELKSKAGESWSAWRFVTPLHTRMVDTILQANCHIITTMRSRMEYVQEEDDRGKKTVRKIGLSPIQRPGMEYEFDIVADLDWLHILQVSKSRCPAVDGLKVEKPGPAFMMPVIDWLRSGVVPAPTPVVWQAPRRSPDQPLITLESLLQLTDAETIMALNTGMIPQTQDELAAVLAQLENMRV